MLQDEPHCILKCGPNIVNDIELVCHEPAKKIYHSNQYCSSTWKSSAVSGWLDQPKASPSTHPECSAGGCTRRVCTSLQDYRSNWLRALLSVGGLYGGSPGGNSTAVGNTCHTWIWSWSRVGVHRWRYTFGLRAEIANRYKLQLFSNRKGLQRTFELSHKYARENEISSLKRASKQGRVIT